ncbi:MAG: hypothetical protein WAM18_10460, partial [Halobacillus sp.]|uniref:hypothetical protein n=1 Tax=Halobacillus sp. TaxID=56800 RepID=UPI003BAFAE43
APMVVGSIPVRVGRRHVNMKTRSLYFWFFLYLKVNEQEDRLWNGAISLTMIFLHLLQES